MPPVDSSYYDLLDVAPSATPAELRKAFRLKALQLHPDRNSHDAAHATAAFQKLKAVYDILCDPDRRAQYDQHGPVCNPHADDADAQLDASALAEFLRRAASRLSKEDIRAYERKYRDGDDERDDLLAHYERFDGAVRDVLQYIPYSTDADLRRFVAFWDARIDADKLRRTPQYDRARAALLADAQRYDEKQRAAATATAAVSEGADNNDGNNKGEKRKRKRARKRNKNDADEMDALAALMQKRAQRAKGQFDAWCDDIERRAEAEEEQAQQNAAQRNAARSSSRATRSRKSKTRASARRGGGDGAPSASGGVRKQRKSSR